MKAEVRGQRSEVRGLVAFMWLVLTGLTAWGQQSTLGGGKGGSGTTVINNFNISTLQSLGVPMITVDPTNGTDKVSGWYPGGPCQTISNAMNSWTSGAAIYLYPGFYNMRTQQIVMPANTILQGAGSHVSTIFGFADCAGVEDSLAPTGGPQVHPGNNCTLQGFAVMCDTNSVLTNFNGGGHSGTWSGIGQSSANPPANLCSTNVHLYDVGVLRGYFDDYHFNVTNFVSYYARNCWGESQGNCVNAVSGPVSSICYETASTLSSVLVFEDCWFTNSAKDAVNSAIGTGNNPSIGSTDKPIQFINCFGFGTNMPTSQGFAQGGPLNVVPYSAGTFTNPQPIFLLSGGAYQCGTNLPPFPFVRGFAMFNNTPYWDGAYTVSNTAPYAVFGQNPSQAVPNSNFFFNTFGGAPLAGTTNYMLRNNQGALTAYSSEGSNVWAQQLAPNFSGLASGITNANGAPMIDTIFSGNTSMLAGGSGTIGAGSTLFMPLGGLNFSNTVDATTVSRTLMTRKGTIQNLFILASTSPGASASNVWVVFKNGVATAICITNINGTTGSDTTHTVAVAAGDEVGLRFTNSATATAAKHSWAIELQ